MTVSASRSRRQFVVGALASVPLALAPLGALASDFPIPGKPVKLVVGFPAGGGTDIQARQVGSPIADDSGRAGGRGQQAGRRYHAGRDRSGAKAPADGHTLLYTPASTMAQLPHTLLAVKYDTFKDFTPITVGALGPLVLVLHKTIPATSVRELVAWAKANPGKLNYVSQGVGTSAHIYGEAFAKQAGIDIVHVPYKGANDVAKDFIAGRVHLQFASSSAAVALAKSGEVRLIAAIAPKRSALFPDLPTMTEQGMTGLDIDSWIGFFGPAGLPPATLARLNESLGQVLKSPRLREEFRTGGVEAVNSTPAEFAGMVRDSYNLWGKMLAGIGFVKQ
jgi:tripartite-type tricarboxylate transporter receptor subunit TctC